jgi:vacuolar protein sorting-associated protein 13A/C
MSRSRNRPKHALYGVTAGANSFVSSLASGVGGLARKPLEGAEREGAWGLFKGIGKGVVGLATKPAIGVFDLASSETYLKTVSLLLKLTSRRRHRGDSEYHDRI